MIMHHIAFIASARQRMQTKLSCVPAPPHNLWRTKLSARPSRPGEHHLNPCPFIPVSTPSTAEPGRYDRWDRREGIVLGSMIRESRSTVALKREIFRSQSRK
ncbi:hypothetical protein FOTG_10062 [Fusarium oxysporum f. sp. vasinfectum 25433]|uniref:Uncharacterized protein n=1 Tax=Fusarium oxysporum f. sp. vasinfectum 25433 TaxID=1089449 RepID=X0LM33_FUSOX|nr:hypothetical protein FOTG_10062 [Fusarium oxysporum f. sp. vasinfectum 25433]